jgi:predicted DNA-binding ribbon-helix-helix protein
MRAPPSGPRKRSVTIAGHPTSLSLEPVFWAALERAAAARALPLSALVAQIDAQRITAANPPNLASAIRVWLFETFCDDDAIGSH